MLRDDRRARRRAAARIALAETELLPSLLGHGDTVTPLHEERLNTVTALLLDSGARTVLDLGCGAGALLGRLAAEEQFARIVGVDSSAAALLEAERRVAAEIGEGRISLRHASFTDPDERLAGFDAAAMVETIEHVAPAHLSKIERAVFGVLRPALIVITTPNREYNALYGIAEEDLRQADHHFEWDRSRFQTWARGVAERNGYRVDFEGIGPSDGWRGSPTQMGVFRLKRSW